MKKIVELIEQGISTSQLCREISVDPKLTLTMLAKLDKSVVEYESLCMKDAELSFKAMEFGSLKYMGQVRMMPVYMNTEMSASQSSNRYRAQ